jgi:CRISPR-associated protein Cas5d
MKVERVSYDVMTPSAARGILEAIYWKPEIRWVVDRIRVLNPIRFTSIRRNEVSEKISSRSAEAAMRAGAGKLGIYVDEVRQQRATLLLRDVGYVIEAHFEIVSGEPNGGKHLDQFQRRARAGQCFTRPYLGCREFAADFRLLEAEDPLPAVDPALAGERDLGWMLLDIDFAGGKDPRFFRAMMADGVIEVPPSVAEGVRA